ncbi:unnamed protein product [Spirodela intermedia]|uniref:Uncharacterized protein n=2 Tax=Spirodela intermedia TaxID=51605 RepID=A0A7I8LIF5_SPIIN|nr:unnamed protein product [Spirodela intermedia]CAA6672551.1 unnamed protein product [Spirodela intermedia]CAA7409823.1 unnamed protein product [Spirodela intermedia]
MRMIRNMVANQVNKWNGVPWVEETYSKQ